MEVWRINIDESVEGYPLPPIRLHGVVLSDKDSILLIPRRKNHQVVIFEVRTAVSVKMAVFWHVLPYNFVDKHRRFGGTYPPPT
jgi:hypothetical protein